MKDDVVKVIIKFPGFFRVVRCQRGAKKWISFQWLNLRAPLEDIKKGHEAGIVEAENNGITTYLAETQHSKGQLRNEVTPWWSTFIPTLNKGGVNKIITIDKSEDNKGAALDRITRKDWTKNLSSGGIDYYSAKDKDSAIDLVD